MGTNQAFTETSGAIAPDSIELPGGAAHWPATLREVARLANAAGLAGYRVAGVELGIDREQWAAALAGGNRADIEARIKISYKRAAGEE